METTARFVAVIATLCALFALLASPARAADVGFQEVKLANGREPPLTTGIWYPTNAPAMPHSLGDVTQTVALDGPLVGRGLSLI